ncbi:hypothetical protein [Azospirillum doebereinerae]|uniref:Uncharacterized protein n=1 Tax=Azospirillum doebereinerae TaxID=92933 RepID=A0A3S0XJQ9_9PROT|nr:hypothetical protein [Azospirillum doebereinerae]RUQ66018.1 hypothetical protein EJ913_24585 [Azospirillum doebereinerae]
MGQPLDPAALSPAQRAVLAAWPEFEEAVAVKWCSLDALVRLFRRVDSLADLPDDEAVELAAMMRTATTRLRLLAPTSARPRPAPFAGQA